MCRSLADKPHFFVSFGIVEISRVPEFSTYSEIVQLKTFLNTLNYASTANMQEVMKFYNLVGKKTFKTDFDTITFKSGFTYGDYQSEFADMGCGLCNSGPFLIMFRLHCPKIALNVIPSMFTDFL